MKLRTSEAVRTIVDHPSRIGELVHLLDDNERAVRGRAASTLARLSESHPGRLLRIMDPLRQSLSDDSAYVRWNLVYALGRASCIFHTQGELILPELIRGLEDSNRIVRVIAAQALAAFAQKKPESVKHALDSAKQKIPLSVTHQLRKAGVTF
jgi:HEAT repeat protein